MNWLFTFANHENILLCLDNILVAKFMATRGLFTNIYNPAVRTETLDQLHAKYHPVTAVVDLQCAGSFNLLAQVRMYPLTITAVCVCVCVCVCDVTFCWTDRTTASLQHLLRCNLQLCCNIKCSATLFTLAATEVDLAVKNKASF